MGPAAPGLAGTRATWATASTTGAWHTKQ